MKNNNHIYFKITTVPATLERDSKEFEIFYDKYLASKQFADHEEAYKAFKEDAHKHYLFGKIHSISVSTVLSDGGNEKIGVKVIKGEEKNILQTFFNLYTEELFKESKSVLWRAEFVLPFIAMRAIKNDVKRDSAPDISPFNKRVWNLNCLDLFEYITGLGYHVPSFEEVAFMFNIDVDVIEPAKVNYLLAAKEEDTIDESSISEVTALVNIHRKLQNLEIIEEVVSNVVIIEDMVIEVKELPLLERLYQNNAFTLDIQEGLKKLLAKKRLSKKDLSVIKDILYSCYIHCNFAEMDEDNKDVKALKEKEIEEFLNSLNGKK